MTTEHSPGAGSGSGRGLDSDDGASVPVFAVSTGRCGSTLLSNMLRLNPDVLSLSEFFAFLPEGPLPAGDLTGDDYWSLLSTPNPVLTMAQRNGVAVREALYSPGPGSPFTGETGIPPILVVALPHLTPQPERLLDDIEKFTRSRGPADVATQHQDLFNWLRRRSGARVWVERSGGSLHHLPELISRFPGARFIHLYRDGRECAYSMSRHGGFRLAFVLIWLRVALGVDPWVTDVPDSVEVPQELRPFMPGSFDPAAFEALEIPAEHFGRWWSEQETRGLDTLAELPASRRLDVSYESIVADPRETLSRVSDFMGVSAPGSWLDSASALVSERPPRWPSLPDADRDKLVSVCDEAMSRLYPDYVPAR